MSPRRKPIQPFAVNMLCPFCGKKIDNDSGPRVDISKMLKLQRGNLAYAHEVCVEVKIAEGKI